MRVLVISLEFVCPFSGNGTASQSFVRGLAKLGAEVCVICACPSAEINGDDPASLLKVATEKWEGHEIKGMVIPVEVWRTHGRTSPWESFGIGATSEHVLETVRAFASGGLDVVIGVDWEANSAFEALRGAIVQLAETPYIYYNFRVYFLNSTNSEEDHRFYLEQEKAALALSPHRCCICLSNVDRRNLMAALGVQPHVIFPALREDIRLRGEAFSSPPDGKRQYLLSCVRIVPEKNVEVFVDCIEALGSAWLEEHGIVPFMVGAAAEPEFAARIHDRLRLVCPAAEIHEFLAGAAIADVMGASLLNFHPALNEAYGMTIVEAAALGCPSIVHRQDIGAADFLAADRKELLLADMTAPEMVVAELRKCLASGPARQELVAIGETARRMALSFDEVQNARQLWSVLENPWPPAG